MVVQDANNGAPAPVVPLVDSLFNPFGGPGGDMWAYAPFGVGVGGHEDPMLGVHPALLGAPNPDAGAGAALFAPSPDVFMHGQGQEQSPGGALFLPPPQGPGQEAQHDPFLQQQDPHDVFLQQHTQQQQNPWPWPHQQQQQ